MTYHQPNWPSSRIVLSVLLTAFAVGCGGSTKTSSSSNWLRCTSDEECSEVDGLCSSDDICVDGDGQPIPADTAPNGTDVEPGSETTGTDDAPAAESDASETSDDEEETDAETDAETDGAPSGDETDEDEPNPPAGELSMDGGAMTTETPDAAAPEIPPPGETSDAGAPATCSAEGEDCGTAPCCDGLVCDEQLCSDVEPAPAPDPDACALPIEPGPCRAAIPAFGFNAESGQCEEFTYGGCQGNDNRFETLEACEATCDCGDDCSSGEPEPEPEPVGECAFLYQDCITMGCCEGLTCNGEASLCLSTDETCGLPTVEGDCDAAFPRFTFDSESGSCTEFTYGGCGGNGNNFETLQDCVDSCGGPSEAPEGELCELPPDSGMCLASMERYYYDGSSASCEMFIYGGCNGNANNFETLEACEAACP